MNRTPSAINYSTIYALTKAVRLLGRSGRSYADANGGGCGCVPALPKVVPATTDRLATSD